MPRGLVSARQLLLRGKRYASASETPRAAPRSSPPILAEAAATLAKDSASESRRQNDDRRNIGVTTPLDSFMMGPTRDAISCMDDNILSSPPAGEDPRSIQDMTHERARDLIQRQQDTLLPPSEANALANHLLDCDACYRFAQDLAAQRHATKGR